MFITLRTSTLMLLLFGALLIAGATRAQAARIKDICEIEGVRDNYLIGYGLVVGLNGTGDDKRTGFTRQSLVAFLNRNNIQVNINDVEVENVAAVMVTATLPPFAKQGAKIDALVSSIGDSENLQGGTLLATPLRPVGGGPAGDTVFAVAQGPISTGGFAASASGSSAVVKNHPTSALMPGGATVECEVPTAFATKPEMTLMLRNPDFTTAQRIMQIINGTVSEGVAQARNSGAVAVKMPASGGPEERVRFIAQIESLEVSPDTTARVVFNERTGTIVMGGNVRISTTIITHGNLIFEKQELPANIPVQPFAPEGTLPILDRVGSVRALEEEGEARVLQEGVTVGEVARALNTLGVTARDMIAILQALKECGALQAELIAM